MTAEQYIALLVAIAGVLVAVARCIAELRAYHRDLAGKLSEAAAASAAGSYAAGVLEARKASSAAAVLPSSRTHPGHND